MNARRSLFVLCAMGFGFAFLYVPILSMVVYSFNNSRLVTVWDHANSPTLRWYHVLLENDQVLGAAWLAGMQAGLYPDAEGFARTWARDRRFDPAMDAATRTARYARWRRAVQATMAV